jgi:hypothetical protein
MIIEPMRYFAIFILTILLLIPAEGVLGQGAAKQKMNALSTRRPALSVALRNYSGLLKEMSLGDEEIRKRLVQGGIDAGLIFKAMANCWGNYCSSELGRAWRSSNRTQSEGKRFCPV